MNDDIVAVMSQVHMYRHIDFPHISVCGAKEDFSAVDFFRYDEGLCVQCMHLGPYDDEPATVALMHDYMREQGCELDITDKRFHHEIYLNDARKTAPDKLKTVIRHPVKERR